MRSEPSLDSAELITAGATSEIYTWGSGRVLKLFFSRPDYELVRENEIIATRAAFKAGLPVPEVIGNQIEVNGRMGIVFRC